MRVFTDEREYGLVAVVPRWRRRVHSSVAVTQLLLAAVLLLVMVAGLLSRLPSRDRANLIREARQQYAIGAYGATEQTLLDVLREEPRSNDIRVTLSCVQWLLGKKAASVANLSYAVAHGLRLARFPELTCKGEPFGRYFTRLRVGHYSNLLVYLPASRSGNDQLTRIVVSQEALAPAGSAADEQSRQEAVIVLSAALCLSLRNNMAASAWDIKNQMDDVGATYGDRYFAIRACGLDPELWLDCSGNEVGFRCRPARRWIDMAHSERPV